IRKEPGAHPHGNYHHLPHFHLGFFGLPTGACAHNTRRAPPPSPRHQCFRGVAFRVRRRQLHFVAGARRSQLALSVVALRASSPRLRLLTRTSLARRPLFSLTLWTPQRRPARLPGSAEAVAASDCRNRDASDTGGG
ncbi:hypothetical protein MC885_008097, partial [Smutsia gigantea]